LTALTINAFRTMIKKINSLSQFRTDANITLNDVAYLLNIDTGNLSKIEKGVRKPSIRIILLYHILFDASLIQLFAEEFKTFQEHLKSRSQKLITQLKIEQPPKSSNRIEYVNSFVNRLINTTYEL
jgi:transcriptional regulator with XRE-family HTH domain